MKYDTRISVLVSEEDLARLARVKLPDESVSACFRLLLFREAIRYSLIRGEARRAEEARLGR